MNLFTTKDDIALNYRTSGEGNAIVMLHTAFDNLTVFDTIENQFSGDNQVVLVDLRGHGYSDKPHKIDFKTYAADIKALLDHLYITRASFIGHELGGSIAASFASLYPDMSDSITLINPTLLNDMTPEERLYRRYAPQIRNWDKDAQQKFLDEQLYYSKRKAKKFLKQVEDTNSIATKAELQAVKDSFIDNDIMDYLSDIQLPTLIIAGQHGERTTIVEAKEVGDYIGEVKFEVFTSSGLYPFVEEKDKFIKLVLDFIKENEVEATY
ncbi:alpha/beta fold hydrolase [Staphylococcus caeli]|uniref:Hydrolase n=1 Tax=Staphylococcus caeli TaxID=2201815 RepID=A0A1D4HZI7_9STAP|nr:alpha/beta hydrolase [Staphylococcus caeli]SCS23683.1 hydrolase [Staphylococcus caeli]SCS42670.1 hydrolase [Staphylococcus caeli]